VVDDGHLIHKSTFPDHEYSNAFEALHFARTIKFIPTGQEYRTLRNGLPMPSMGLGTGGLYPEETYETLATSMRIGYRLFDLAREYNNEATFAEVCVFCSFFSFFSLPITPSLFLLFEGPGSSDDGRNVAPAGRTVFGKQGVADGVGVRAHVRSD
jgi:hypothetical protein